VIARKKLIILILSVAIIIIIALVAVLFCIKSDNSTTPDDLITYNNFNNLSKNHDTFFIEVTDLYDNKDTLYIENNNDSTNIYSTAKNAESSWNIFQYNGYKYISFSDKEVYSVCSLKPMTATDYDLFSFTMLKIKHSNAKQTKFDKTDDGYVLEYDDGAFTFTFDKNNRCTLIKETKNNNITTTKFEYNIKKDYFDCLKNIDTQNTVNINITDVNSSNYETKTYTIPAKTKFILENTPEAILYLDSNCQQVFSTETHTPSLLLSKETVSENLDLYMVVSQKTPIFPIID
jgi:hypothetical protein